jgi:hypothetical protein
MKTIRGAVHGVLVPILAFAVLAAPIDGQSRSGGGFRAASPNEFAGEWRMMSDDGTSGEVAELEVSGNSIRGMFTAISRGYFSGRTTVEAQTAMAGSYRSGGFDIQLQNAQGGSTVAGSLRLRGEFLILLVGGKETGGYARPERSLVESAAGSAEAAALARGLSGKIFATSQQAGGRGAFVGSRRKVSFCSDGSMTYDSSNLASTPGSLPGEGVDMGSTVSRRGRWSVVLYTGVPVVRADWQGTGTSYSLVAYFRVRPSVDGRSANIDGIDLPLGGSC